MKLPPVLATFLLAGCCWQGPILYPPDPAAMQPIAAGRYRASDPDGHVEVADIVRRRDGSLGDARSEKDVAGFFAPPHLAGRDLWLYEMFEHDGAGQPGAIFALAERTGDGLVVAALDCQGNEALVRAAGGAVSDATRPGDELCTFADRASLERALVAYAARHARLTGTRLVPVNRLSR